MFGLCHLGVVKALHLRGLLPRIITGTATGSLIAALVGIHTEDELLDFLNGDGIDLSAFAKYTDGDKSSDKEPLISRVMTGGHQTILRRLARFVREGHFLDVNVLEECVRANVGDMTFEEAYARTKRVLNITVGTSGRGGVPNLLNYLTAPNVVSQQPINYTIVYSMLTHFSSSGRRLWLRMPHRLRSTLPLCSSVKMRPVQSFPGRMLKKLHFVLGDKQVILTANLPFHV